MEWRPPHPLNTLPGYFYSNIGAEEASETHEVRGFDVRLEQKLSKWWELRRSLGPRASHLPRQRIWDYESIYFLLVSNDYITFLGRYIKIPVHPRYGKQYRAKKALLPTPAWWSMSLRALQKGCERIGHPRHKKAQSSSGAEEVPWQAAAAESSIPQELVTASVVRLWGKLPESLMSFMSLLNLPLISWRERYNPLQTVMGHRHK